MRRGVYTFALREVSLWCGCGLRERVTSIETVTDVSELTDSRVVGHDDSKRMWSKFRKAAGKRVRTINAGALKQVLKPFIPSEQRTTSVVDLAPEDQPPYVRRHVSRT